MHRLPKVIRHTPVLLTNRRMSTVSSSDSSPVAKNYWKVKHHPPPDIHIVTFTNRKL
ncbi:hypothetical protein BT96DRAFT_918866, partial [Gymnopus androsaceus JB14]